MTMQSTTASLLPLLKRGLLLGALCLGCVQAQAITSLTLVATPSPAVMGSALTLDVLASGAVDLYAFQLSINFDPTFFQASGVTEGGLLASGGATFFSGGTIDNTAGVVSFTFDTLLSATPGVSGSGQLESLTFQTLRAGGSSFTLGDVFAVDSVGNELQVNVAPLNVTAAVPEPASVALMLAGLAAVGWRGRRLGLERTSS